MLKRDSLAHFPDLAQETFLSQMYIYSEPFKNQLRLWNQLQWWYICYWYSAEPPEL